MTPALLAIIYLAFVSLGLPDGLLGAAWPAMHADLGAAVSLAGAISVVICLGTIVSSLMTDALVRRLGTGRLTAASVALTAVALFGFSTCTALWHAFVATHYAARHMNWLHCCWGIGAAAGPMVMSWQMSGAAGWPGGYRVVGVVQVALVAAIALSLPLWHDRKGGAGEKGGAHGAGRATATRRELLSRPGVPQAMAGFLCYCALESSCGLWASTFLVLGHGVSARAHLEARRQTAAEAGRGRHGAGNRDDARGAGGRGPGRGTYAAGAWLRPDLPADDPAHAHALWDGRRSVAHGHADGVRIRGIDGVSAAHGSGGGGGVPASAAGRRRGAACGDDLQPHGVRPPRYLPESGNSMLTVVPRPTCDASVTRSPIFSHRLRAR